MGTPLYRSRSCVSCLPTAEVQETQPRRGRLLALVVTARNLSVGIAQELRQMPSLATSTTRRRSRRFAPVVRQSSASLYPRLPWGLVAYRNSTASATPEFSQGCQPRYIAIPVLSLLSEPRCLGTYAVLCHYDTELCNDEYWHRHRYR